ncbi:MAG: N-acetylneuraminate lyase [Lentisphaerae bacterium RIFOXYA12_FULL_48_11]|nr:MAG: N-acetylneuraminate lyase [Lentisphaerae bacterium RIFOXYA12_FULL_48_11]
MKTTPLTGLVAAAHTPFNKDGSLNLEAVESQALHFIKNGMKVAFIGGSTGEVHSLNVDERIRLTQRWLDITRGSELDVIVHVGSNCLLDARTLAAHAQKHGARAMSAFAPSYFKPKTAGALVDCCAEIAGAAPELPFYFYDIPSMTGVNLSMPEFLELGCARIPNLVGIKWTNSDLYSYQVCQHLPGDFDLPWGNDEYLIAALAVGARGGVGSSYCFAAQIYHRVMKAFAAGDMAAARKEQYCSVQLIKVLYGYGYMGAAKATMKMLGVDVGPARLPNTNPDVEQVARLRADLEKIGFFDWIKP